MNATWRPSPEITGKLLSKFPCAPLELTLTRVVVCAATCAHSSAVAKAVGRPAERFFISRSASACLGERSQGPQYAIVILLRGPCAERAVRSQDTFCTLSRRVRRVRDVASPGCAVRAGIACKKCPGSVLHVLRMSHRQLAETTCESTARGSGSSRAAVRLGSAGSGTTLF